MNDFQIIFICAFALLLLSMPCTDWIISAANSRKRKKRLREKQRRQTDRANFLLLQAQLRGDDFELDR